MKPSRYFTPSSVGDFQRRIARGIGDRDHGVDVVVRDAGAGSSRRASRPCACAPCAPRCRRSSSRAARSRRTRRCTARAGAARALARVQLAARGDDDGLARRTSRTRSKPSRSSATDSDATAYSSAGARSRLPSTSGRMPLRIAERDQPQAQHHGDDRVATDAAAMHAFDRLERGLRRQRALRGRARARTR